MLLDSLYNVIAPWWWEQ